MASSSISPSHTPRRTRSWVIAAFMTTMLLAFALIVFYPILLLLCTGLKSPAELVRNTFGIPQSLYLDNLFDVWESEGLDRYLINSIIVTGGVVVGTVVLSALGGFGFG